MDKLERMKQAEQFIQKDILYGTIAGLKVKDLLESNADTFVKDDETVDQLATKIKNSLLTKTNEQLYVPAHSLVEESLPSDIFSDNSKELFKDEVLSKLPYVGNIVYDGKEINIAEYIKSLPLNDDFEIQLDSSLPPRKIFDEYKQILMFEPVRLTIIEKEQAFLNRFNLYRSNYSNIDDILKENNKFQEDLINGIKNMNDQYDIVIGETKYDIDEYIDNLYKKYSERLYNSVDSKPSLVEPINITRGNGVSEATSNYIFLTDLDIQSLVNNKFDYTANDELRDVLFGILHADASTIKQYKERIDKLYNNPEVDEQLKDKVVKEYIDRSRNMEMIQINYDDILLMTEQTLNKIEQELEQGRRDYSRTMELDEKIKDLWTEIRKVRDNSYEMQINMANDIEEKRNEIVQLMNQENAARDNENHIRKNLLRDLEDLYDDINRRINIIQQIDNARDRSVAEIGLNKVVQEYNTLLDNDLLSEDEKKEHTDMVYHKLANAGINITVGRGR